MMKSIMIIMVMLPIIAMLNLISNQTSFLMTLLSLEGITLSLVLFVPLISSMMSASNPAMTVVILTFGACEASLGLSLMVAMSRSCGNDLLKSLTTTKC